MTTPSDPNRPNRPESDVDAVFADLVSSMPDLASIDASTGPDGSEAVEIVVPHPHGTEEPLRLVLEVPPEVAPMVRAEFSPDRVAAMAQAISALAELSVPPTP